MPTKNTALENAVKEYEATGKQKADLVRDVTTETTLRRYIRNEIPNPNPFITRTLAKRLKKPYADLFGGNGG